MLFCCLTNPSLRPPLYMRTGWKMRGISCLQLSGQETAWMWAGVADVLGSSTIIMPAIPLSTFGANIRGTFYERQWKAEVLSFGDARKSWAILYFPTSELWSARGYNTALKWAKTMVVRWVGERKSRTPWSLIFKILVWNFRRKIFIFVSSCYIMKFHYCYPSWKISFNHPRKNPLLSHCKKCFWLTPVLSNVVQKSVHSNKLKKKVFHKK